VSALTGFAEYADALRARLDREQRPADGRELEELRRRWEAADRHHQAWERGELEEPGPGHLRVVRQPPAWELLEVEFGTVDELPKAEPSSQRRAPLPPDVNVSGFSSIQKAVRLFEKRETRNTVASKTIFTPQDATRIRRLWELGYLRLNNERERKLLVDLLVGRRGKSYALRLWDEREERWVDPLK
jgi:hypothetical protein